MVIENKKIWSRTRNKEGGHNKSVGRGSNGRKHSNSLSLSDGQSYSEGWGSIRCVYKQGHAMKTDIRVAEKVQSMVR